MKCKLCILALLCVLLQNCRVVDSIPYSTPTYSCIWQSVCHVQFNSVHLSLPGIDCAMPFYNGLMSCNYPYASCNDLVGQIGNYQNDGIQINWTTTVDTKECRSGDKADTTSTYNQYNFYSKWQSNNYITEALQITDGFDVNLSDLKHELTIQIWGVTNDYDGTQGLISWRYSWLGNNAPSNYDSNNNTWYFEFPNGGLKGTYTPYGDYPRQVYVHDQFEFL